MSGRRGFLPTCYTEFSRWAVEHGFTSKYISEATGLHQVTVRKHMLGGYICKMSSIAYRSCLPGVEGIPLQGFPQRFAYPLPIRGLPERAAGHPPGLRRAAQARRSGPGASQTP